MSKHFKWILVVVWVFMWASQVFLSARHSTLQFMVPLVGPIFALLCSTQTLNQLGLYSKRARVTIYMVIGLFFWLTGEALAAYYQIVDLDAFPSFAHIFFFIGDLILFIAVAKEAIVFDLGVSKLSVKIKMFLSVVIALMVGIVILLELKNGYYPHVPLMVNIVGFSIIVGDMLLTLAALYMFFLVWVYRKGTVKIAWLFFFMVCIINLIGDVLFGFLPKSNVIESNATNLLLERIWSAAYLFAAAYFWEVKKAVEHAIKGSESSQH
jgi:hypothetical protein